MENIKRTLQSCGNNAVYEAKNNKEKFEDALKRQLTFNTSLLCNNFKADGLFRYDAYPNNRLITVGFPEKHAHGYSYPFIIELDFGNHLNDILNFDYIKVEYQKNSYCQNDAIQNKTIPNISLQQKASFENQKSFDAYCKKQKVIEEYLANRTEVTIGPDTRNPGYVRGTNNNKKSSLKQESLNVWDYVSNGSTFLGSYPTYKSSWAYYEKGGKAVSWIGKNGVFYEASEIKMNGGYSKSIEYANKASRITRNIGNSLTWFSIGTSIISTSVAVANDKDNTSTWVNAIIGIGTGALTIVAGPVIVTGAIIVGVGWGISQIAAGDEINGWIDDNYGYK